ncbi:hypothetical protein BI355_1415 [Companilactobacillus crustorum]|nr:hypothetical protein BI355_1415 [Companilactobacillus crustorum]
MVINMKNNPQWLKIIEDYFNLIQNLINNILYFLKHND